MTQQSTTQYKLHIILAQHFYWNVSLFHLLYIFLYQWLFIMQIPQMNRVRRQIFITYAIVRESPIVVTSVLLCRIRDIVHNYRDDTIRPKWRSNQLLAFVSNNRHLLPEGRLEIQHNSVCCRKTVSLINRTSLSVSMATSI